MGKAVRLRGAKSKPFTTTPSRAFHSADPASTLRPSPSTDEEGYTPNTRREKSFRQGDRCAIRRPDGSRLTGMVQFVGEIGPLGKGVWVGVQLDEPKGDSNGLIHGRRIFDCPPNHGAFYPRAEVEPEVEEAGDDPEDGGRLERERQQKLKEAVAGEPSNDGKAARRDALASTSTWSGREDARRGREGAARAQRGGGEGAARPR